LLEETKASWRGKLEGVVDPKTLIAAGRRQAWSERDEAFNHGISNSFDFKKAPPPPNLGLLQSGGHRPRRGTCFSGRSRSGSV
jgi:hypothetical protein